MNAAVRVLLVLAALASVFPAPAGADGLLGSGRDRMLARALQGNWVAEAGRARTELRLGEDGAFSLDTLRGTYLVSGNALVLNAAGAEYRYGIAISGDVLTLSGGDLAAPLVLGRQSGLRGSGSILHTAGRVWRLRLRRLAAVIVIVLASRILIFLLRRFSRLLVFGEWGPLHYIYRTRKNRTLTLHSVFLNAVKYAVYFTALGYALGEMGVNYTAYVASLSVVGLAVGFGSQGLVQDVVTGFFIIFENQFDVGDMVEIAGKTGRVTELGLRMTALTDYSGTRVVIPNRTIGTVSAFSRGGVPFTVDVPCEEADRDRTAAALDAAAAGLPSRFRGLVTVAPAVPFTGPGGPAARLTGGIWPGQSWIIDGQLLPRVRAALDGIASADKDGICVFYHDCGNA